MHLPGTNFGLVGTAHVSPARLLRAHTSFPLCLQLGFGAFFTETRQAFTYHSLLFVKCPACREEELLHRGVACYPAVLCLVLHVSSYKDVRFAVIVPRRLFLGCWGKGGLAAVRDNLDLSPRQEASGATGSGSSQLAASKPWSDTYSASRNASAPNHAIRVCVERARLILVCFLSGFPCRHTTSGHRERSQPVTSMSW